MSTHQAAPTQAQIDMREADAASAILEARRAVHRAIELCGAAGSFSWDKVNGPLLSAAVYVDEAAKAVKP